jgi:hypothetical protein
MSKCELFDFLDSCDFFIIKSLLIGDFGAEIKKSTKKILWFEPDIRCFIGEKPC